MSRQMISLMMNTYTSSFYEGEEDLFGRLIKCRMKILLWDFNAKIGMNIFSVKRQERSFHETDNHNSVVNLATYKYVTVKTRICRSVG
jgi:GTP:adenosylcobinamide-phosphate guanylyltransferase